MTKYDPKAIEPKWQQYWDEHQTYRAETDPSREKFFGLIEFPYPSGAGLHVGHPRSNTAMDVITRYHRMNGKNVLFPIGFDSFGLPTENFAIKTGRPPKEITDENIATFTRQLKALGFGFDWSRAVTTSEPEYYKWTQWIFLQLYKQGLAYKTNQPINWCPKDKIGLANEEVVDGCCERCGNPVEKRNKEQWMLAITKYADKLLAGLNEVDYISRARTQQENWIGRSEGAEIEFELLFTKNPADNDRRGPNGEKAKITVFTTRPDTLFGATYLVLAPEHLWVTLAIDNNHDVLENKSEVVAYVEAAKHKTDIERSALDKEKTGVELRGVKAINPATGEQIPLFVADYVLGGYGAGAIMAVPAHDERDWEFAKKFGLPIRKVVAAEVGAHWKKPEKRVGVYAVVQDLNGNYLIQWDKKELHHRLPGGTRHDGETLQEVLSREFKEETGYRNFEIESKIGSSFSNIITGSSKKEVRYERIGFVVKLLNDEQDVVNSEEDVDRFEYKWVTIDEAKDLFAKNPQQTGEWEILLQHHKPSVFIDTGVSVESEFLNGLTTAEAKEKIISWLEEKGIGQRKVQYKLRDWVFSRQRYWGEPIPLVHCEKCAGWVPLPVDQLPLTLPEVEKYLPTDTGESPLAAITEWVNTTCPQCGGPARRETDTMPNWAGSSWYFLRYTDPKNDKELASKEALKYWTPVDWYNGGMEHTVLHLLYSRFWNQFLFDIGVVPTLEPYKKRTSHGMILAKGGEKMSKSKGNVVNPDEMVDQYGADALRTYIMFMGPFDQAVEWDTNGLVGVRRFLDKVWNLQDKVSDSAVTNPKVVTQLHQTIKKVTDDIANMSFNTSVAKLMELANAITAEEKIAQADYQIFIKLLSVFAPHIAEELWSTHGTGGSVALASWPQYQAELAKSTEVTVAVQVNGKVRAELVVSPDIAEVDIKAQALAHESVQKWLEGREPKKIIYVPGRLVSIVV